MAIKPILFNTDMVKAILEGRKTQTRRLVKPQPVFQEGEHGIPVRCDDESNVFQIMPYSNIYEQCRIPPWVSGDVLWVRERYCTPYIHGQFAYYADYREHDCIESPDGKIALDIDIFRWKPSIHMPKEAARIFLIVKRVRAERLQDISFEDCKAEGIWDDYNTPSHIYHENLQRVAYPVVFKELWNRTIKKSDLPKYGWDANPWVWVIEFERCEKLEGFPDYVQEAKLR